MRRYCHTQYSEFSTRNINKIMVKDLYERTIYIRPEIIGNFYNLSQVSKLFRTSPSQIMKWVNLNELPCYEVEKKLYFNENQIKHWSKLSGRRCYGLEAKQEYGLFI